MTDIVELFAEAADDVERTKYKVLAKLKAAEKAFVEGKVYPYLKDLINARRQISRYFDDRASLRSEEAGEITGIDPEEKEVEREWAEFDDDQSGAVIEKMMRWAAPRIESAIEEGRKVYDDVEEDLEIDTVGIVPNYLTEGYLMVPHFEDSALLAHSYKVGMVRPGDEPRRVLKTERKSSAPIGTDPEDLKEELLEENPDLPVPAAYHASIGREVPYEPTLWPITKRTLIRRLASDERDD